MLMVGKDYALPSALLQMNCVLLLLYWLVVRTTFVDPTVISPLMACQLIALDKNPGVRPIGIGETVRRIIAKAVLCIISKDIQVAAGSVHLCAGQPSGCCTCNEGSI